MDEWSVKKSKKSRKRNKKQKKRDSSVPCLEIGKNNSLASFDCGVDDDCHGENMKNVKDTESVCSDLETLLEIVEFVEGDKNNELLLLPGEDGIKDKLPEESCDYIERNQPILENCWIKSRDTLISPRNKYSADVKSVVPDKLLNNLESKAHEYVQKLREDVEHQINDLQKLKLQFNPEKALKIKQYLTLLPPEQNQGSTSSHDFEVNIESGLLFADTQQPYLVDGDDEPNVLSQQSVKEIIEKFEDADQDLKPSCSKIQSDPIKVQLIKERLTGNVNEYYSNDSRNNVCVVCKEKVYAAEIISISNPREILRHSFHRLCFRCAHCKLTLQGGRWNRLKNNYYCDVCFKSYFTKYNNTIEK